MVVVVVGAGVVVDVDGDGVVDDVLCSPPLGMGLGVSYASV